MNKHAELTTKQIVALIILITSFIIILVFIFFLDPGGITEREICHNSVVLKGKGEGLVGKLDCKIQYVCISGGGECEDFNPTETIDVDLSKPNAESQVMKAIADEMANCWWMFGEGKSDYLGIDFWEGLKGDEACAICSILVFDDEIKSLGPLDYNTFYSELMKPKDESQSYLKYLYRTESLASFKEDFRTRLFDGNSYLSETLDFNKKYSILTGMARAPFWLGKQHIPIVIIKKTSENYEKVGCADFITKA